MNFFHSLAVCLRQNNLKAIRPKKNQIDIKSDIPKTWKLPHQDRVNFRLSKLSSLSGHDKIDLFKDYLRTHSRLEAVHVYRKLVDIGLTNRLEYKDFHNLFRLLLQNPLEYRKVIIEIRNDIISNGFIPTTYFDNEYMACLIKWGNITDAKKILDVLHRDHIQVSVHSYELFLEYYLRFKMFDDAKVLVQSMKVARPLTRPSMAVYLKIMAVYTALGDSDACKQVFLDGEENLERLYVNHLEATSQGEDTRWKIDNHIQLFNAYLNNLFTVKDYDKVLSLYKEFKDEGRLLKSKSSANTFHIVLKTIHAQLKDGKEYDLDTLDKYWGDLVRFCVPDYLHYSRFMNLVKSVKVLEELYRNACLTLNISINGSKRQSVESAYLASLLDLDYEKAVQEMSRIRKSQTRKPLRFVYEKFARVSGDSKVVQEWIQEDLIDQGDIIDGGKQSLQ